MAATWVIPKITKENFKLISEIVHNLLLSFKSLYPNRSIPPVVRSRFPHPMARNIAGPSNFSGVS